MFGKIGPFVTKLPTRPRTSVIRALLAEQAMMMEKLFRMEFSKCSTRLLHVWISSDAVAAGGFLTTPLPTPNYNITSTFGLLIQVKEGYLAQGDQAPWSRVCLHDCKRERIINFLADPVV